MEKKKIIIYSYRVLMVSFEDFEEKKDIQKFNIFYTRETKISKSAEKRQKNDFLS
jgi:hypothetical protein